MSARYINISDKFILEISNTVFPKDWKYDIIENSHTGERSFYVSYQHATETNSNRDNGAERLESPTSNQWLYLDVDRFKANTGIKQNINKVPPINLQYQKMRLHILAGYNMQDIRGFILNVSINNIRNKKINLANFAFVRDFPNQTISNNPEPLYLNARYYNRYIEMDLLSPERLMTDLSFLVDELSEHPIDNNTLLNVKMYELSNIENLIFTTNESITRSETVRDKFRFFGLQLREVGDYFEYHALYRGGFPGTFIHADTSKQWVITHKLEVFEQVGFNMIKTSEIERIQRDDFNKPLKFRPIIENADIAFSFSIKYTCIFRDINSNEQFYRVANLAKLDPKKYGETLKQLNVSGFTNMNVYHKMDPGVNLAFRGLESGEPQTVIVNNYIDRINILNNEEIQIHPYTNVYEFNFEKSLAQNLEFFLSFIADDEEKIYIPDVEEDNTDTTLYFKIFERNATQIRSFTSREYFIIGVNPNGESTVVHRGKFKL